MVNFQKELRRKDLALTHTIVQTTNDKSLSPSPHPQDPAALRKVGENERGIVVRGSRVLATLAPFSDEIAIHPGALLGPGCKDLALSFCIPLSTPGLRTLCRESYSRPGDRFHHPLSSRFDEQDAFMLFDSVEVPWHRIFINGNIEAHNSALSRGWFPNVAQQTMIRAQTKLEFAHALATRMAAMVNDKAPVTQQLLGELACYAELTRNGIATAEAESHDYGTGAWFPAAGPMNTLRAMLPIWFPRVNEIIRMIGSHNLLITPSEAELQDEVIGPMVEQFLHGDPGVSTQESIATYRLAWGFAASALGSRNEQYERSYLATSPTSVRLVDQFLPGTTSR